MLLPDQSTVVNLESSLNIPSPFLVFEVSKLERFLMAVKLLIPENT